MIPVRGPTQLKGPLISPNLKQKPTSINKFTKDFRDILAHKGDTSPFSCSSTPEGILLGNLGGRMPHETPNPDPISDQKMSFFTPVLTDLASKIHTVFRPHLQNSEIDLWQVFLDWNANKRDFLKSNSNSYISLSFLFLWN